METHILRQEQNHMATTFDFRVSCSSAELDRADRLLDRAHAEITRLERELTEFLEVSPVYQLNRAAALEPIVFTKDGFALLMRAVQLSKLTATAFNPLAKSESPAKMAVDLGWDEETREVWKLSSGVRLSFGAIGKGYALDFVRTMLAQEGFENFLLSAGGSSVFISGFQAAGVPWTWGWSWKKNEAGENLGLKMTHSTGQPVAIGVSGTHEKGEHIIRNQACAGPTLKSALIAHSSATEADALSTGLFVLGWDSGLETLSQSISSIGMAAIDDAEIPHWNGIFQGLWKNLAQSFLSIGVAAFGALWLATSLLAHSSLADAATDAAANAANSAGDLDLSALDAGSNTFTPYILERSNYWILLPLFALLLVLVHLKKNKNRSRRNTMTAQKQNVRKISAPLTTLFLASTCWLSMEQAKAVEIEPMGKAIMAVLGTPKAQKKVQGDTTIFYAKDAAGHVTRAAFIQSGVYQPNCGHKWVVGIDGATGKVTQVRPIEMACPHAFPTKAASFLDQYKGKGPADVAQLDAQVVTVAKATGSCKLTTEAVKKSITTYQQVKSSL